MARHTVGGLQGVRTTHSRFSIALEVLGFVYKIHGQVICAELDVKCMITVSADWTVLCIEICETRSGRGITMAVFGDVKQIFQSQ